MPNVEFRCQIAMCCCDHGKWQQDSRIAINKVHSAQEQVLWRHNLPQVQAEYAKITSALSPLNLGLGGG